MQRSQLNDTSVHCNSASCSLSVLVLYRLRGHLSPVMAQQLVPASVATAKAVLPEGARAVTAEDNLFDQKSHANPLARLMEIVANSVEHGGASHVPPA